MEINLKLIVKGLDESGGMFRHLQVVPHFSMVCDPMSGIGCLESYILLITFCYYFLTEQTEINFFWVINTLWSGVDQLSLSASVSKVMNAIARFAVKMAFEVHQKTAAKSEIHVLTIPKRSEIPVERETIRTSGSKHDFYVLILEVFNTRKYHVFDIVLRKWIIDVNFWGVVPVSLYNRIQSW